MTRLRLRTIAVAPLMALIWTLSAPAGEADWEAHYTAGMMAIKDGRYPRAEELLKQAVAEAESRGTETPNLAQALRGLASLHLVQGHPTEANLLLERSLLILLKTPGADPEMLGHVYHDLGCVKGVGLKNYAEARALLGRALSLKEKALGTEHAEVADTLCALASLHVIQEEYAQADARLRRALAIQEKALGTDHIDVARTLGQIAQLRMLQAPKLGHERLEPRDAAYNEAEALLKRALAIRQKVLGADDPRSDMLLEGLANCFLMRFDNARAEPVLRRLVAVREKALGPMSPKLETALYTSAEISMGEGRYREARPILERLIAIRKARGEEVPEEDEELAGYVGRLRQAERYADLMDNAALRPTQADLIALGRVTSFLHASDLPELLECREISIDDGGIDDDGLIHLRGLIDLERFEFDKQPRSGTGNGYHRVTDAGLTHFRNLTALKSLSLRSTRVRGPGLAHLERLTGLENLDLGYTPLGDAGLSHLPGLARLRSLNLNGTQVSVAGIIHLKRLAGLKTLSLFNAKVSPPGVEALKRAMPELTIDGP